MYRYTSIAITFTLVLIGPWNGFHATAQPRPGEGLAKGFRDCPGGAVARATDSAECILHGHVPRNGAAHGILLAQAAQEDDPDLEDSELDEDSEVIKDSDAPKADDASRIQVRFQQKYKFRTGFIRNHRGFAVGFGERESTEEYHLVNRYQASVRLQTSPDSYYFFRMYAELAHKFEDSDNYYEDGSAVGIREGYLNHQSGSHGFRIGGLILKLGRVDFDSPINVLNMSDLSALERLELDDSKLSVPAIRYQWQGEESTTTFYLAPFHQETPLEKFTRVQDRQRRKLEGKQREDESSIQGRGGFQFQKPLGALDIRFGLFRWFDKDNHITWTDVKDPSGILDARIQVLEVRETTINFSTLEFDVTLGDFVLKADMGFFRKKNFYDFLISGDDITQVRTFALRHHALAASLERKFESWFIMPVYSYRWIGDAPADSHIFSYENEETPKQMVRDLKKHKILMFLLIEPTDSHKASILLSHSFPFEEDSVFIGWKWNPSGSSFQWELKLHLAKTEILKMTGKPIESKRIFLNYSYNF